MNEPVAAVTVTAPSTSRRAARSGRRSGTTAGMVASRTMPTGTLMKKTQRQPGPAVRIPPMRTPAVKPTPPREAHMLRALLRSTPWKMVVMVASAAGDSSAAPAP
jgi:hypothetical protein